MNWQHKPEANDDADVLDRVDKMLRMSAAAAEIGGCTAPIEMENSGGSGELRPVQTN